MKFSLMTAVGALLIACLPSLAQDQAANTIRFSLPSDGYATIVINDAHGKRVRNLLASMPYKAGEHSGEWDGRDDKGEKVPAGTYQWAGIHRGDVHAVYRGSFQHGNPPWPHGNTGGWIADHSPAVTVVRVGDRMILGATESEWGHGVIASDLSGQKLWGVKHLAKRGWAGGDMLAVDGERVFASSYLGQKAIWEVDPKTGENHLVLEEADLPADNRSDAKGDRAKDGVRLIGAHGGEVYAVQLFADEPRTLVFKAGAKQFDRLKFDRTLPVRPWHIAWLSDGRAVVVLDKTVELLDTRTGRTTPLITEGLSQPHSIAIDGQDRIFISDQGATGVHKRTRHGQLPWRYMRLDGPASHQIKIFDASGKRLATVGVEGGQQVGAFNPQAFFMPAGLAIDARGRLWVTEMNYLPKRVTVWAIPEDLAGGQPTLEEQFVGPTLYGGGAAMIDPREPWRIMDTSYGHVFDVDLAKGAYRVASVPWRHHDPWKEQGYRPEMPFTGRPGVVIDIDGRRFTALQGGYMHGSDAAWHPTRFNASGAVAIGEYVGEGDDVKFIPRAALGSLRMWMRGRELNVRREEQWMPQPILEAARRLPKWSEYAKQMKMDPDAPDVPHVEHKRGSSDWIVHPWPLEISGFIWTDANGDAQVQPEEIAFHPRGDDEVITLDKDLNIYFSSQSRTDAPIEGTFKLPRQGFNSAGAPLYTWETMQKIGDDSFGIVHVGEDGSLLSRTSLRNAEGKLVWSYPSSNEGVKALGPRSRETLKPGAIHRVNALWGIAEAPNGLGQVYMLHNNDGMVYLLTREGYFVASLFRPYSMADGWDSIPEAKPGIVLDNYSLQDECFNGHFARAEASGQGFEAGRYYLLGAGRSAVVEITGLESMKRLAGGQVQLTEAGLYASGEKFDPAETGPSLAVRRTVAPIKAPRSRPGQDTFAETKAVQWSGATVRTAWDDGGLHMKWEVRADKSPFVNKDHDFTQLFSTGDAADIQIDSPTLGKLRFLVTMHRDEPVVVRMRYGGEATADAVTYTSGVAETKVAEVIKLRGVTPGVRRVKDDMYVLQFRLPWSALGVESPRAGLELPVELGLILSDPTGTNATARDYWASGSAEMVADVPTEARPTEKRAKLILGE
jgi:hypothetical protein